MVGKSCTIPHPSSYNNSDFSVQFYNTSQHKTLLTGHPLKHSSPILHREIIRIFLHRLTAWVIGRQPATVTGDVTPWLQNHPKIINIFLHNFTTLVTIGRQPATVASDVTPGSRDIGSRLKGQVPKR